VLCIPPGTFARPVQDIRKLPGFKGIAETSPRLARYDFLQWQRVQINFFVNATGIAM